MNSLYVYVNHSTKNIDCLAQELPENWSNIQGLNFLSEEQLENLEWAGHPGYGWVKLSTFDLSDYSFASEWMQLSKNGVKEIVKKYRKEATGDVLNWNGNTVKLDENTRAFISLKLSTCRSTDTFLWKFVNRTVEITGEDLLNLCTFINEYIQTCFNLENDKNVEIDSCETLFDLGSVDLNISWPSTTYGE